MRISILFAIRSYIPIEFALCSPIVRNTKCLDDYKTDVVQNMSSAWRLHVAHGVSRKYQRKQKAVHDKKASNMTIDLGDKVFCICQLSRLTNLQVSSII